MARSRDSDKRVTFARIEVDGRIVVEVANYFVNFEEIRGESKKMSAHSMRNDYTYMCKVFIC